METHEESKGWKVLWDKVVFVITKKPKRRDGEDNIKYFKRYAVWYSKTLRCKISVKWNLFTAKIYKAWNTRRGE